MKIIRTKFNKEGDMIYISHLDLQQLLQRAFRRAEIDLVHSQGFNPHPKISYGNALALGTESQGEYVDIEIEDDITVEEFLKRINEELSESNEKLEKAYLDMVQTLRYTVEAKDTYTRGHSDRVSEYSVLIGEKLGLPEDQIKTLRIGGLFHDIGKIGIPDSILLKPDKLSDDEYSQIKNHPSIGAHILGSAEIFKDIIPIVKHHHERYDGNGYPSRLKGEEIPYIARIAAVADTFDAMTSRRSYRGPIDIEHVKEEIKRCEGTQFDPQIAEVFLDILNNDYDKIKDIQEKYLSE